MTRWSLTTAGCLLAPALAAQEGPTDRAPCDPAEPPNKCPGAECRCTEDVLSIRLEQSGGPILEVDDEPGLLIEATVVLETRSAGMQGWSYGVRHDGRALTIESVTTDGTDAGRIFGSRFCVFTRSDNLMDCTSGQGPTGCSSPGSGFISATVLTIVSCGELPVGTNTLARVTYRLEPRAANVSEEGLLLEFTDRLAHPRSPPVAINLTIHGRSALPRTLADGKIIVRPRAFHRGDPDGDGRLSVADAVALLLFLFLSGPSPACLEAGDADDDGRIDTTDPVIILRWLFTAGSPPAPPGPPPAPCGPDPDGPAASLGCDTYEACP